MIQPGTYLNNRYEIIEKIGSGGMADVYKAKDHRLNRNVAIKVLKPEFSRDQNFVKKFRAEAQAAAGLSHPNIVNVYDVSEDNGMYFIVMELIEGITLKEFIQAKGKLSVRETVGITIQIAQGLEVAHQNHIIHRDIKPQNIILSRDGTAKVTDFGIAKAVTSNTITSNAVGSVHYISPEQARGGYSDEKSDIYSLAVTMYEMLSGRVPFTGDSTVNVALKHIQEEPIPLRELDPSIPVSIERIVQKCMQKKPERRYLSVSDLIVDLKRAIRNPDDDFVGTNSMMTGDAPTMVISERELNHIKGAAGVGTGTAAEMAARRRNGYSYDDDLDDEYSRDRRDPYRDDGRRRSYDDEPSSDRNGNYRRRPDRDDRSDEKELDPKVEKIMVAGGIVAVVILVLVIIFLLGRTIGLFRGGRETTTEEPTIESTEAFTTTEAPTETSTEETSSEEELRIPRIIGATLQEATDTLEAMGLTVERGEDKPSDIYEAGLVIEVTPNVNEVVQPGDVVTIILSSGSEEKTLQDLRGMSEEDALSYLNQNDLRQRIERQESDSVDKGKVISTSPAAGSSVEPGETITLVISEGRGQTTVPDLRGLTEEEAEAELSRKDLVKGKVSEEYSADVEEGKVISQETDRGSKVDKGTAVNFTISLGPQTFTVNVTFDNSFNPFATEEEEGYVQFVLDQNGEQTVVKEATLSYGDFPYSFEVESKISGDARIYMIVDGETMPGSVNVSFR